MISWSACGPTDQLRLSWSVQGKWAIKHTFKLQRNETYQAAYYKECMKQKATNIIICPNSTDLLDESFPGHDLPALNRKLRKLRKKGRKNKRKRKKNTKNDRNTKKRKIRRKSKKKSKSDKI